MSTCPEKDMNNLDVVVPVDAVMDEPSSNQPVKNTPNKNINKNSKILKKVIPLPIAEEMLDKEFPTVPASHVIPILTDEEVHKLIASTRSYEKERVLETIAALQEQLVEHQYVLEHLQESERLRHQLSERNNTIEKERMEQDDHVASLVREVAELKSSGDTKGELDLRKRYADLVERNEVLERERVVQDERIASLETEVIELKLDLANEKGAVDHSRLSLTRMTSKFGQLQRENDLLQKKLLHSASVGSFNNYHLDVSESSEGTDNRHRDMQKFRCHANPSMGHLRSKSERFAVRPKELTSLTSDNITKHTATTAATSAHCFSEADVSEKSEDSIFTRLSEGVGPSVVMKRPSSSRRHLRGDTKQLSASMPGKVGGESEHRRNNSDRVPERNLFAMTKKWMSARNLEQVEDRRE